MTAINGGGAGHFPGSFNDPSKLQQVTSVFYLFIFFIQVYQFLEDLKKDQLGWKKSADNIVGNNTKHVFIFIW